MILLLSYVPPKIIYVNIVRIIHKTPFVFWIHDCADFMKVPHNPKSYIKLLLLLTERHSMRFNHLRFYPNFYCHWVFLVSLQSRCNSMTDGPRSKMKVWSVYGIIAFIHSLIDSTSTNRVIHHLMFTDKQEQLYNNIHTQIIITLMLSITWSPVASYINIDLQYWG